MMKRLGRLFAVVLLLAVQFLLISCQKTAEPDTTPKAAEYTIYVMGLMPSVDPFWATIYRGVKEAERIFPVRIVYPGLDNEQVNPIGISNKLEPVVAARPDGIVLAYWFLQATKALSLEAINQGIPIIAYNAEDFSPPDQRIPYLGYIGQNERVVGQVLAEATVEEVKIERAVIGIQYPGSVPLEARAEGIVNVLENHGIPFDKVDITTNPSGAQNAVEAYMHRYPETNMVFLLGPVGTHPILRLIEEKNWEGRVQISTFDVTDQTLKGIEENNVLFCISQQPFAQGFLAVQQMYLYLEYGILPPERTETGPILINIDNINIIRNQLDLTGGA